MSEEKKLTGFPSIDKPWLKYYSDEAINAPLPECSIYEYLLENNQAYPRDVAILYLGRKITFGELFRQIDRTAAAFCAIGVKPKDIVTVALPSIPEALYVVYALNKIGAVSNMIHPLAGESELVSFLNEVNSTCCVLFDGTYQLIKDSLDRTGVKRAIIVSAGESLPFGSRLLYFMKNPRSRLMEIVGILSWPDFLAQGKCVAVPENKKDCREPALISHTGGTTGDPKGVMCSDNNVNACIFQIVCNFTFERQGRCLSVLPPFINYSLVESMLAMLAIGYQVVLLPSCKPQGFAEYIDKYRPNIILSVPAYWEALLKNRKSQSADWSCLEHIYYGGEGMSREQEREINRLLLARGAKSELCKGLGATELVAGATQSFPDCNTEGSVGIPLVRTNCAIIDPEAGEELRYNQQGEICFSGPTIMLGYYNNQEATDEIVKYHDDGQPWLHTGDMGYINEDGVVFVSGRIKRILATRGKDGLSTKMFPDRIEQALYQHPGVALCCVIGIPDENRRNYPKAFIVLKNGVSASDALSDEILQLCREQLPDYMVPDEIEYRDDLPRTPRGKIDFRALEDEARQSQS